MESYLYRYFSFESFVDMIQKQCLTFVLPTLWDDTQELLAYKDRINRLDNVFEIALFYASLNLIYAQCWSKLGESDAMWRIYNYSNMSIRIKVKRSSFELLQNIELRDVIYTNNYEAEIKKTFENKDILQLIAIKRKAFAHEKEVRVIDFYRFTNEDAENKVTKLLLTFNEGMRNEYFMKNEEINIEKFVEETVTDMNLNQRIKTKKIAFGHINNFICDVMLHPMAPDWFVDTVSTYCSINGIKFVGKSSLYN